MKLSKHAKFWALGALGGVGLFALGVFAQQTLQINPSEQDLFSDLKAVFFLDRNGDEIKSIVRWNASGSTLVTAPTSELTGGEAKNTLQNNASIIGSTDSSNTSAGAFLIATNGGKVEWESMQSFIWGANNTTLSGFNTIAVATKDTNINADNALALASKNTNITAKDAIAIGWEYIKLKGQASLAIWSKIDSAAQGAMVFNAKNEQLNLNNESNNTFVINAENGLIVNTNTSANPKIQLTVSGAIKLWEVNNAPAQASPYISTKKVGNVTCICGKVNNGNIAISKYSRNNKQHAEICQKVCNNESPTLPGQCGAAATNYPLGQTQWSTDDFCQWGLGYAGAKPTFPALGGQTTWTCESFPSGGVNCTATRKWCGDSIKAAGEQCDLGTNNGRPDSNCSASCENVKAPKCWANAKSYLGSDVAWAQPNGFCTDGSVLGEATPAFWNGSTSGQKTWTCKNKNNKNLSCSANRLPPAVAGVCGTTLNTCSAGTPSGQTSIAHGKRWSCDGIYGGSNKTCSTCDSGYKYNTTTNICEIDCPNPIYRHTNGVTIKAAACAEAGREYLFEGQKYYVARDKNDIKAKIAANTYPANRIVTTRVTDMQELFKDNTTFNQPIGSWDTSNVTTMATMFSNARNFNQDISYWDTSKVTSMSWIFGYAKAFNQPLNSRDVSKVNDSYQMFLGAESFNQPLNSWNTSNFTSLYWMFRWAKAFNQNINNWNINNVTNLGYAFSQASAFNQPLDNWNINAFTDDKLQGMLNTTPLFQAQQPYCTWAKWSAKKWKFVSMGLNACPVTPICPSWFTAYNGKCVKWKCEQNAQSVSQVSWVCKDKSESFQDGPHLCIDNQHWPKYQNMPKWNPITGCPSWYKDIPVWIIWSMPSVPKEVSGILTARGIVSSVCSSYSKFECTKDISCEWDNSQATLDKIREFSEAIASEELGPRSLGKIKGGSKCTDSEGNILSDTICENAGIGTKEDACRLSTTCSEGFSMYNGKCVKWECEVEDQSEKRGCYTKNLREGCYGSWNPSEGWHLWGSSVYICEKLGKNKCTKERGCSRGIGWGTERLCEWIKTEDLCKKDSNCAWGGEQSRLESWLGGKFRLWWESWLSSTLKNLAGLKKTGKKICTEDWGNTLLDSECDPAKKSELSCGTTQPISSQKINGQCKAYPWTHPSQPATSTANGCVAGDYEDIADDAHNWKWKCKGKNGGTSVECSASKQAMCPSEYTLSNGKCVQWKCEKIWLCKGRIDVPGSGIGEECSYRFRTKAACDSSKRRKWFHCNRDPNDRSEESVTQVCRDLDWKELPNSECLLLAKPDCWLKPKCNNITPFSCYRWVLDQDSRDRQADWDRKFSTSPRGPQCGHAYRTCITSPGKTENASTCHGDVGPGCKGTGKNWFNKPI